MMCILRGERIDLSGTNVHSVILLQVWIFLLIHATGFDNHRAGILIHLHHALDQPLTPGNLPFHFPRGYIIQIKVSPSVSLGDPQQLTTFFKPVAVEIAIIDKGVRSFIHHRV